MNKTETTTSNEKITDEQIEIAAIALYEASRQPEYVDPEWDWPNIDRMYDWDGDDADLPNGKLRPDGDWLRNRYRRDVRVVLTAIGLS